MPFSLDRFFRRPQKEKNHQTEPTPAKEKLALQPDILQAIGEAQKFPHQAHAKFWEYYAEQAAKLTPSERAELPSYSPVDALRKSLALLQQSSTETGNNLNYRQQLEIALSLAKLQSHREAEEILLDVFHKELHLLSRPKKMSYELMRESPHLFDGSDLLISKVVEVVAEIGDWSLAQRIIDLISSNDTILGKTYGNADLTLVRKEEMMVFFTQAFLKSHLTDESFRKQVLETCSQITQLSATRSAEYTPEYQYDSYGSGEYDVVGPYYNTDRITNVLLAAENLHATVLAYEKKADVPFEDFVMEVQQQLSAQYRCPFKVGVTDGTVGVAEGKISEREDRAQRASIILASAEVCLQTGEVEQAAALLKLLPYSDTVYNLFPDPDIVENLIAHIATRLYSQGKNELADSITEKVEREARKQMITLKLKESFGGKKDVEEEESEARQLERRRIIEHFFSDLSRQKDKAKEYLKVKEKLDLFFSMLGATREEMIALFGMVTMQGLQMGLAKEASDITRWVLHHHEVVFYPRVAQGMADEWHKNVILYRGNSKTFQRLYRTIKGEKAKEQTLAALLQQKLERHEYQEVDALLRYAEPNSRPYRLLDVGVAKIKARSSSDGEITGDLQKRLAESEAMEDADTEAMEALSLMELLDDEAEV